MTYQVLIADDYRMIRQMFEEMLKSIPVALIAALIIGLIVFFAGKGSMRPVHSASQANDYMDKQVRLVYSRDHFVRTERKPKQQGSQPQK